MSTEFSHDFGRLQAGRTDDGRIWVCGAAMEERLVLEDGDAWWLAATLIQMSMGAPRIFPLPGAVVEGSGFSVFSHDHATCPTCSSGVGGRLER